MGKILWPGDKWRCSSCLEDYLPGKDAITKSRIEYGQQIQEAFDLEDEGRKAEEPRNRAAWARMMAAETRKQAMVEART